MKILCNLKTLYALAALTSILVPSLYSGVFPRLKTPTCRCELKLEELKSSISVNIPDAKSEADCSAKCKDEASKLCPKVFPQATWQR